MCASVQYTLLSISEKILLTKMAATPQLDEYKKACGSDKLNHALRVLFLHEEADNEGIILLLVEKCDDVRARIATKRALLEEVGNFSPSDIAVGSGLQCLQEAQNKDFQLLVAALDLASEARIEKRRHVVTMEQYN